MFTGIIQAKGNIVVVEQRGGDRRYRIDCGGLDVSALRPGDSIAVDGVCLTTVAVRGKEIVVDVSLETLRCTTFDTLAAGADVNLEPALLPATPLGGHFVSGHVDGVGRVSALEPAARSLVLTITIPAALTRYVAAKGSICMDGISLTVNEIEGQALKVNIIPHTLAQTTLASYDVGRRVNVEVDLLARYLERLLQAGSADQEGPVDRGFLQAHGFASAD
ncbi:MAG: riboflavin synthase [Gammaproteobacteria bacterium]